MRSFYRVPQLNWPPLDDNGEATDVPDAFVLCVTNQYAYLHSATTPNVFLAEMGADLIGNSYSELHSRLGKATRKRIFECEVERDDVTLRVRLSDVKKGDTRAFHRVLIPHSWSASEGEAEQKALDLVLRT